MFQNTFDVAVVAMWEEEKEVHILVKAGRNKCKIYSKRIK